MTMEIKNRFSGAVLTTVQAASLYGADLRSADLRSADLRSADLRIADLRSANLYGANLYGADLRSADLRSANLSGANLSGADLSGANLSGANLSGANLSGANLSGANLRSANLSGAKGVSSFSIVAQGALTVFKKTTTGVAILEIPRSAGRCNAIGSRKGRAEYAIVIFAPEGARSLHDWDFKYMTGETVRPDSYDSDIRVVCSHGIHFFLTAEEAEAYS